jgi:hypothetical protein
LKSATAAAPGWLVKQLGENDSACALDAANSSAHAAIAASEDRVAERLSRAA